MAGRRAERSHGALCRALRIRAHRGRCAGAPQPPAVPGCAQGRRGGATRGRHPEGGARDVTDFQLGVSRTPLREAIKLLAAEGLADLLPNRGAIAVKLNEADVMHTFEVLAGIEGLAGELAAQRITDQEFAEIKALHYEMMASVARSDVSAYYRLNAAIHVAVNEAAKNPVLQETYRRINNRVQSLRFRTNLDTAQWKQAVKEHEAMIEALGARNAQALRELLVGHLYHKRDAVLAMLRGEAAGSKKAV
jgi:DNA-binding GntR family transcriptional regulator